MGSYNESDNTGINVSIQIFDKSDLSKLTYRFDAKIMKWDSIRNDWKLINISEREFDSTLSEKFIFKDTAYASQIKEIGKIYLSPSQILKKQLKPDELVLSDMDEFITTMKASGQNVSKIGLIII
jgi:hypothetical protein